MTFEQFQASRRPCEDLGEVLSDAHWEGEPAAKGNLYLDALYIEEVTPHWPESARKAGKWHLLIGREEWISNDLADLERKLYEFALDEGYCEQTEGELCDEYAGWLKDHGYPEMCALELSCEDVVKQEDRPWLSRFIERWEMWESRERAKHMQARGDQ